MWVDILVCCPVELFGTSPVREVGFGELVLSTAPISRGSGGGLFQCWQSCGTIGRTVGQRFLLDRIALPCGFGTISEEQWCVVLGSCSDYRLLVG